MTTKIQELIKHTEHMELRIAELRSLVNKQGYCSASAVTLMDDSGRTTSTTPLDADLFDTIIKEQIVRLAEKLEKPREQLQAIESLLNP